MPVSRAKSKKAGAEKKVRFVKGSKTRKNTTSERNTPKRAPQRDSVRKTAPSAKPQNETAKFTPGWKDLTQKTRRKESTYSITDTMLGALSTLRFSLSVLAVAGVVTLYVGHVHATEDVLAEVQQMRRENLTLHLRYNRVKGVYDRSTGPAVIYRRARALGLEERIAGGPTIRINP